MTDITIEKIYGWLLFQLEGIAGLPTDAGKVFHWIYLVTAVVLAWLVFRQIRDRKLNQYEQSSRNGFLAYLFPKNVYLHPSSIVDYQIFLMNSFAIPALHRLLVGPFGQAFSVSIVTLYLTETLTSNFGSPDLDLGFWSPILFTLVFALATDLGSFASHALHHKIPIIWPLHSVHHSAEVMNPLTVYRKHPLFDIVKHFMVVPILGTMQGLVTYFLLDDPTFVKILGTNVVFVGFGILGGILRHTHIWLSFGPVLEHIFISPAQHQIHHSARLEHRDVNFGKVFAFWDWMFGTLVIATDEIRENLILGMNVGQPQPHPTLAKAYIEPLQAMARTAGEYLRLRRTSL